MTTTRKTGDPKKPNPATAATVTGQEADKIRADHLKYYQHHSRGASWTVTADCLVLAFRRHDGEVTA